MRNAKHEFAKFNLASLKKINTDTANMKRQSIAYTTLPMGSMYDTPSDKRQAMKIKIARC